MKWLVWIFAAAVVPAALAYVPPYAMILSRTAENHGRGVFVIEQDVTYRSSTDTQVVHETWTVLDEYHMRLSFHGVGALKDVVHGSYVYENHARIANEDGLKNHHVGEDWVEPFFHFRFSKNIRPRIVQLKMAPADSVKDRPPLKSDGPPDYDPEPYVQLARQNGMVSWAIAKPEEGPEGPGLWIEQDQFVVTKLKLPTKSVVEAADYAKYDGGIYLPRLRTYTWNDKMVTVQVRSVRSLGPAKSKDLFSAKNLPESQFAASDILKDFYLRFR